MGNVVSGKKEVGGGESSGSFCKNDDEGKEDYMEYALFPATEISMAHSPNLFLSPQVPLIPLERSRGEIGSDNNNNTNGIPTMITWNYDGNHIAIEGSWDQWKTRELLERNGKEFNIVKVLESGVYRYRFVVDGHYRYDPQLPLEFDDISGNFFNILDLQDHAQEEVMNNVYMGESPPSPVTSYNNIPFSLQDFQDKLPVLPPLLQRTPLNQPPPPPAAGSSTDQPETLERPLPAILNHLYIEKGHNGQSIVGLGCTHRFRNKYVTTVLYKSLRNPQMREIWD